MLTEGDVGQTVESEAVERAQLFCDHYKLDSKLQRAIVSHTKYFYHYNYVVSSEEEVMSCLPIYLQKKIKHELAKRSIKQIDLFHDLSEQAIGDLVLRVKSVGCNANFELFSQNDEANELYIQRIGRSKLYENGKKLRRDSRVERGRVVGEYCLKHKKRRYTLKCKTWSEFYVLTKKDINQSITKYYDDKEKQQIWKNINKKLTKLPLKRMVDFENDEEYEMHNGSTKIDKRHIVHELGTQRTSLKGWGSNHDDRPKLIKSVGSLHLADPDREHSSQKQLNGINELEIENSHKNDDEKVEGREECNDFKEEEELKEAQTSKKIISNEIEMMPNTSIVNEEDEEEDEVEESDGSDLTTDSDMREEHYMNEKDMNEQDTTRDNKNGTIIQATNSSNSVTNSDKDKDSGFLRRLSQKGKRKRLRKSNSNARNQKMLHHYKKMDANSNIAIQDSDSDHLPNQQ